MNSDDTSTDLRPEYRREDFASMVRGKYAQRIKGKQVNTVTMEEIKNNLEQLIQKVVADAEPIIVMTENGQRVVLLPLDEFNTWKETLYLLSNPANTEHLRISIAEAKAGQSDERELYDT